MMSVRASVTATLHRPGSPVRWSIVLREDGMSATPHDAETNLSLGPAVSGSKQDILHSIWRSEALSQAVERANE